MGELTDPLAGFKRREGKKERKGEGKGKVKLCSSTNSLKYAMNSRQKCYYAEPLDLVSEHCTERERERE